MVGQPFNGNSRNGLGEWECPVSHWSVPDNVLEKQVPWWNWPTLAEITPLNFRFISMGLVVHGLSCFSVPTQRSFWHPASFPFSSLIYLLQTCLFTPCSYFFLITLPLQFLRDPGPVIPLPHRQLSVFLSPHSLLSHPALHFPALWTGHSAVTEWDTLLWVPLVNVSITSSLRQRGENP